eukprot:g850.t1
MKVAQAKFKVRKEDVKDFDINRDNTINLQEVRAGRMKRYEAASARAWTIDRDKALALYEGAARYSKFQQRMLDRLDRSKDVWEYKTAADEDTKLIAERLKKKVAEKTLKQLGYKSHYKDCFEAAVIGDADAVREFVESKNFDIFKHNENDGGNTLMHYAALYGHVELIEFLVSHTRVNYGEERLNLFLNAVDSCASKMTPLIEACRNNIGYMNDRLKIIKILVENGADVTLQDVSGDNCLHWAVRRCWLPVVRFICYHTSAAVFASITDNFSSTKPIDIAANIIEKDQASGKSLGHGPTEIFNILQDLKKGCNIRLKIQCMKKKRVEEEGKYKKFVNTETDGLENGVDKFMKETDAIWDLQCRRASDERRKLRGIVLEEAHQEGLLRAQKWIKTSEGRQAVKAKTAELGGGKIARDKAVRTLLEKKENQLVAKATARFDRKNPSVKQVVEEELQELQRHIDALDKGDRKNSSLDRFDRM